MVKKITKYAKFVVCCALIMSFIAPSYAALSASDGSAFVTKAEFDSALADFNARLTTFEAGINSKIDSQVTSYLDRNGIWNGKKQDLEGGINDTTWTDYMRFWNPGVFLGNSTPNPGGDFTYTALEAYGVHNFNKDAHYIPSILNEPIDDDLHLDEFGATPLGFLIIQKSYYSRMQRYLFKNDVTKKLQAWIITPDWSTTGGVAIRSGFTELEYFGNRIMNKPFKLISNINKSGLLFLTIDANPSLYWGWQFMWYNNNNYDTTNYTLSGSAPHWVGGTPALNFNLDFCVGKAMEDETTWNGTKFTHDNFKTYSKATFQPASLTTSIDGGTDIGIGFDYASAGNVSSYGMWLVDDSEQKKLAAIMKLTGPPFQTMQQFFVSKGDEVWIVGNFSWKFGNGGGRTNFLTSPWIILGSDTLQKNNNTTDWKMSASVY